MTAGNSIVYEGLTIPYDITYSARRKSISIIVHQSKRVEIKAPTGTPATYIHDLAGRKVTWIVKRFGIIDSKAGVQAERKYHNGEIFLFLGNPCTLLVRGGAASGSVLCNDGHLMVNIPCSSPTTDYTNVARTLVQDWYRDQASRVIGEKVLEFARSLGIEPPPFKLRNVKRRWGSCSHKNTLNFNTRLVMAPIGLVEYVVMHELCHIRHKNHSRYFWEFLRQAMPDYPERRKLLKREGYRYVL